MPSRYTTPVRWRDDTGWELRCPDCAASGSTTCFWPLTDEFWRPKNMARCRACHRAKDRAWARDAYFRIPGRRDRRLALLRAAQKGAGHVRKIKRHSYYLAHRDLELARVAARYVTKHDEILAQRRARYAERKAAA